MTKKYLLESSMRRILLVTVMGLSLIQNSCRVSPPSQSQLTAADENAIIDKLNLLTKDINLLRNRVKSVNEARLYVMAGHIENSRRLIGSEGIANLKTIYSLQKLVSQFIYAEMFFQFIRSEKNAAIIDRILETTIATNRNSLRIDIGYDEARSSILADNLDVMRNALNSLIQSDEVPMAMKDQLRVVVTSIGLTYSLAMAQGDRPIPFQEGTKRCQEITAIYPLLDGFIGTSQLFAYVQEIRGTNEFLKEYLQVNLVNAHP